MLKRNSPSTVGCVIKVDRESLRVLDQNGSVKTILPSQITNKIEKRKNAVATDRNGSEIRYDDTVREIGGESKTGSIVHIHRSFLFLLNREQPENSGIFVVRAANVATVAAKGGRVTQQAGTGPDLNKMNPALQRNGASNGSMAPPKSFGRDRILGQTVKVRKGPYKGLLGIVKDTTDTEARIELHSKNKTISLAKDILGIQDPISGNSIPYSEFTARGRGAGSRGGFGGATPARSSHEFSGSRTPQMSAANGGRTPAWGASRTPAWAGGSGGGAGYGGSGLSSRTPAYIRDSGMNGGRTPGWAGSGDGGRTSYGGAGGVSQYPGCTQTQTSDSDDAANTRMGRGISNRLWWQLSSGWIWKQDPSLRILSDASIWREQLPQSQSRPLEPSSRCTNTWCAICTDTIKSVFCANSRSIRAYTVWLRRNGCSDASCWGPNAVQWQSGNTCLGR